MSDMNDDAAARRAAEARAALIRRRDDEEAVCQAKLKQAGVIVGVAHGPDPAAVQAFCDMACAMGFAAPVIERRDRCGTLEYIAVPYVGRAATADENERVSLTALLRDAVRSLGLSDNPLFGFGAYAVGASAIVEAFTRQSTMFRDEAAAIAQAPYTALILDPPEGMLGQGVDEDADFSNFTGAAPLLAPVDRIVSAVRRAGCGAERDGAQPATWSLAASMLRDATRFLSPRPQDRTRFVVAGLLPADKVTLLVGEGGKGKSTLALQIGAAIGSGEVSVLGRAIDPAFRGGTVAYLSAEDDGGEMCDRMARLAAAGMDAMAVRIIPKRRGVTLGDALREARQIPGLAAVMIDPAQVWMEGFGGSASDDRPVSAFLEEMRIFAEETGAAVLVIHHPPKPPRRRTAGWMVPRGSQVWENRVRVLLSFEQVPGGAVVTVQKSNLREAPKGDMLRLSFDPEAGMHHACGAGQGVAVAKGATDPVVVADAGAILPAMARLAADGQKVTRTGKGSLYGRHMHRPDSVPEVHGWPRARCEAAVEYGLAAGMLRIDPTAGIGPI